MMTESRKECQMRHENGNCTVAGGFCTAVNDPICEALHNAFDCGYRSALRKPENAPMTNADRIRDMSDEELAACLLELQEETIRRFANFELPNAEWMTDWLQQPAEEE